jgi:hypothetical protein
VRILQAGRRGVSANRHPLPRLTGPPVHQILAVAAALPGLIQAQAPTYTWERVEAAGRGAFEDDWQPGKWPMAVHPIAEADGLLMVGNHRLWSSPDGLTWNSMSRLPGPRRIGVSSILHGNRLWVIGGQVGSTFTSQLWTTAHGTVWFGRTTPPWSGRRGSALVSFRGFVWVFGGENKTKLNDVWRTTDGNAWERVLEHGAWSPESQPIPVVLRDSLFLIGGTSWTATTAEVWASADGERWQRVVERAPWGPRVFPGVVAFDDQLWILGGVRPDGTRLNDIWRSPDGRRWNRVTDSAPWTPRAGNRAVVYRSELWLLGGKGKEEDLESGYAGDIWRMRRQP